ESVDFMVASWVGPSIAPRPHESNGCYPRAMATQADVRRIALALPGAREAENDFAFTVEVAGKPKGFAWVWKERVDPKKPRVPNPAVLAIRVAGEAEKVALLGGAPEKFFTEPHYDGFPAVLVRLAEVSRAELKKLLADGMASLRGSARPTARPRRAR